MRPKRRLVWTLTVRVVGVAVAAMLLTGGSAVYREVTLLQESLAQEAAQIKDHRLRVIEARTRDAKSDVEFLRQQIDQRLREELRQRVDEACELGNHLVRHFGPTLGEAAVGEMIREALRPVRWRGGRGYFFIIDRSGINHLYPPDPSFEGTNVLSGSEAVPDPHAAERVLEAIREHSEGFADFRWLNPDNGEIQDKTAYVRLFEPLGWIIGTGEYVADKEAEVKTEALKRLADIRFPDGGYVFVGQWDGTTLGDRLNVQGRNMWELTDPDGVKIVQELISLAETGGGFVEYAMPGRDGQPPFGKISFAAGIPEWRWYLGTGMSLKDINDLVSLRRAAGISRLTSHTLWTAALMAVALCACILLARRMAFSVESDYRTFADFFKRAATDLSPVRTEAIAFAEFEELAVAANRMIEEQSRADRALKESESRFRTIIENVPAEIQLKGLDGHYIICNRAFAQRNGIRPGSNVAEFTSSDLFPRDYADMVAEWDRSVVKMGKAITRELAIPLPDRSEYDAVAVKFPVFDSAGRVSMVGTVTMDIGDLKQAENNARHLQDEIAHMSKLATMGEMAASVSHELNQPLLAISNFAAGIRRRIEAGHHKIDEFIPVLQRISDEANRAGAVIRTIRNFTVKKTAVRKPVDINHSVREIAALIEPDCRREEVALRLDLDPALPQVEADPVGIRQVLLNLARNALEAKRAGPTAVNHITISTRTSGGSVEIKVADGGIGISVDGRAKLFEPFFTTKPDGTGLGLSICRRIIDGHGGAISVDSEPGQGTTFTIRLPAFRLMRLPRTAVVS